MDLGIITAMQITRQLATMEILIGLIDIMVTVGKIITTGAVTEAAIMVATIMAGTVAGAGMAAVPGEVVGMDVDNPKKPC